jgi:GntR family transcriptional regulator
MRPCEFRFQLDLSSGVPAYRQLIDQVLIALSTNALKAGDRLPAVRHAAASLSINPNTVVRAYKELEIRGILSTQQGTGTFIAAQKVKYDDAARQRRLSSLIGEMAARAGAEGFSVTEIRRTFDELFSGQEKRKKRN